MYQYICNCLVGYDVGKMLKVRWYVDSSSSVVMHDFMEL